MRIDFLVGLSSLLMGVQVLFGFDGSLMHGQHCALHGAGILLFELWLDAFGLQLGTWMVCTLVMMLKVKRR